MRSLILCIERATKSWFRSDLANTWVPSELTPQHSPCTIGPVIFPRNILLVRDIERFPLDPHRDTWIGWLLYSGYTLQRFGATTMFRSSQDIFVTLQYGCRCRTCGSNRHLGNVDAVELWRPKCTLDWISIGRWSWGLNDSSRLYQPLGAQKPLLDLCTRNPLEQKRLRPIPTF